MVLSTSHVITSPVDNANWLAFQPPGSGSTLQPLAHSVIVPFTRPHSVSKGGAFTGRMMGLGIQGHEIGVAQLQVMKAEITDRRITKALWDQLGPNAQHFLLAQVKKGMANHPNGFGLGMGPEEYEPFISKAIQEAQRMSKAEPSALEQKNQEIAVRNEKLESTAKWINMFGPKSSSIESALMQILNERTQGMELNQADQVLNKILSDPNEMDTIYRSALQRLGDPAAGLGKPRENAKEYLRAYYQLVTGIKDPSLLNALADQTLSQIELSIPNKELNPVQKVDHFLRFFISGSPQTNQELIVSSGLKMLTPRLDAKTPPEALRGPLAEWLFRTVASDPNVQKLRKQLEASGINPEKDERLLSLNAQVAIQKLQWLNSRSKLANETLNSIIKGAQNLPIPSAQGTTQPPAWPNALPEALPEKFTDLPTLAQEIYKNLAAAHGLTADELFYEQKRLRAAGKPQATAQDAADSLTTNRTQSSSNLSPLSSSNIAASMSEVERNSAIRDGKAWLKKWGINLDSPTTTNRQIAETILKAIKEGKFDPATAVNVWTALASKERSREVESVLKEPSDFILKSTTLEGALAATRELAYNNPASLQFNAAAIIDKLASLITGSQGSTQNADQIGRELTLLSRQNPVLVQELLKRNGVMNALESKFQITQAQARDIVAASAIGRNIDTISAVFGQNISPILRSLAKDIKAGAQFQAYQPLSNSQKEAGYDLLYNKYPEIFRVQDNLLVLNNIETLAQSIDIDAGQLLNYLTQKIDASREILAQVSGDNPLGVPATAKGEPPHPNEARAIEWLTAVYAQLQPQQVPISGNSGGVWQNNIVNFEPGRGNALLDVTGRYSRVLHITDLDGVYKTSYGEQGVDVVFKDRHGNEQLMHVNIPVATGTLVSVDDLHVDNSAQTAYLTIRIKDKSGQEQTLNHAIDPEAAALLQSAQADSIQFEMVKELNARKASTLAMQFFKHMNERAQRGDTQVDGIGLLRFGANTFGTIGRDDQSAGLKRSHERSGWMVPPGVPIASGGTSITLNGKTEYLDGFPVAAQELLIEVAETIPAMIQRLGAQVGMPEAEIAKWKASAFDNPDIPSIFITKDVIAFYREKFGQNADAELDKLQQSIESEFQDILKKNPEGAVYFDLHHTKPRPGTAEDIAPFTGAAAENRGITSEWQMAVKGRKIMPTLYFYAEHLLQACGVDLWKELMPVLNLGTVQQVKEHMWKLTIDQVATVLGQLKTAVEQKYPGFTWPKLIISADTLGPGMTGSDIGMVQLHNLIGKENLVLIHTNTANPNEVSLETRGIPFELNSITGDVIRGSIDGYVSLYIGIGPEGWSRISLAASQDQQKPTPEILENIRNRKKD